MLHVQEYSSHHTSFPTVVQHGYQSYTSICSVNKHSQNNDAHRDSEKKSSLKSLQRAQLYMSSSRNIRTTDLELAARHLNLKTSFTDDAKNILTELTLKKTFRGETQIAAQLVCLYYSCVLKKAPRSISEICSSVGLTENMFLKVDKTFREVYRDNKSTFLKFGDMFYATEPVDILSRNISKLVDISNDESKQVRKYALEYLDVIRERKMLVGKTSAAITNVVIFKALNRVTKSTMSKSKFCATLELVSPVTLQTMLKELDLAGIDSPTMTSVGGVSPSFKSVIL